MTEPYYSDESVTIYHGDALEMLPVMAPGAVSAVVTDPPYIIGSSSSGGSERNIGTKGGMWADLMNSALWFATWYAELPRVLSRSGSFWTFCNWRTFPVVTRAAMTADLPITSLLVWDKEWIGPGGHQGLRPSYELVALMAMPDFAVPDRGQPDILRHRVGSYKEFGHPAEKPEGLLRKLLLIADCSGLVLDPFMGSGTTLAAAKGLGLHAVGIDAEERYCEMAARRLSQEVLAI